jgi:glutamate--cysteine ligase
MGLKMRTLAAAAPIVSAIFSNSPLNGGEASGALSCRAKHYFSCDPKRSGFVPPALGRAMSFSDFIEWALDVPMIFRATPSGYESANFQTFRTVLRAGFADGTRADEGHWRSHLSQIYTDVRLRDTIELRAVDGAPVELIPAVAAFWTGLAYERASLLAAWELFCQKSLAEHYAALKEIPFKGLQSRLGRDSVLELARELLRIAKNGFNIRIATGLEDPASMSYFEPLDELLDSGITLAQRVLLEWEGRLEKSAARYVDAYRVRWPD